jgi:hypothetical protein
MLTSARPVGRKAPPPGELQPLLKTLDAPNCTDAEALSNWSAECIKAGQEEGKYMKTKLLAMALLAGGSIFAQTRFSIGVGVGGYAPGYYAPYPPAQAVVPPCPGPGYNWVDGYWSPYGGAWVPGYWARPSYIGGFIAGPRFVQPRFDNRSYGGYRRDFDRGRESSRRGYSYQNGFRGRR